MHVFPLGNNRLAWPSDAAIAPKQVGRVAELHCPQSLAIAQVVSKALIK